MAESCRVIIHAGFHKSGSSFLQSTFFANRAALEDQGIGYFPFMANHSWPIYLRFAENPLGHHLSIRHKIESEDHLTLAQDLIDQSLQRFLTDGSTSTKIISGESISKMSESALAGLRDYLFKFCDDITVVLYCRNYFEYLSSVVQENIKNGASFDDAKNAILSCQIHHSGVAMPDYFPKYREKIETFDRVFGKPKIVARAFHKKAFHGGNLLTDFCTAIGYEALAPSLKIPPAGDNKSVSAQAVAVMDRLNQRTPLLQDGRINPNRPFQNHRHILDLPGPRYQVDDPELLEAFRQGIRQDADWLRIRMGEAVDSLLLAEPAVLEQPAQPSESEMVEILLDCVTQLNRALEAEQAATKIERNLQSEALWSEEKIFALSLGINALDDPTSLVAVTYRLLQRGALSLAAIAADRAVKRDANLTSAITAKAAVAIRQRRWSDAKRLAENALEESESNPAAWRQLGISLRGLDRIEEAEEALGQAIKQAPKNSQNHFQLGSLFFKVGRLGDAEQALRTALSLSPSDRQAKAILAKVLTAQKSAATSQARD